VLELNKYGMIIKDPAKNVSMGNTGMLQPINVCKHAQKNTSVIEMKFFVKAVMILA